MVRIHRFVPSLSIFISTKHKQGLPPRCRQKVISHQREQMSIHPAPSVLKTLLRSQDEIVGCLSTTLLTVLLFIHFVQKYLWHHTESVERNPLRILNCDCLETAWFPFASLELTIAPWLHVVLFLEWIIDILTPLDDPVKNPDSVTMKWQMQAYTQTHIL